jgi:antitoxin (DNA-binding transcriptional repressor) of toxin-antitoxin stability system
MEKATIAKLKNNLSAYLRKVRAGQQVVIYDRDVPIARLERIDSATADQGLAALRARGVVRPAARATSAARLLKLLANPLPAKARLLQAVQEERAQDR